jgi:hypothetical protein
MKFQIIFFTLLLLTLLSCNKKPTIFQIEDKEELVIESTSIGCFHSEYYVTRIVRHGGIYKASFNELRDTGNNHGFKEYFKEYKLKEAIWNQKGLDIFLQTLKTDTSGKSTTNVYHTVIKNKDTLRIWESTGNSKLLKSYYLYPSQ